MTRSAEAMTDKLDLLRAALEAGPTPGPHRARGSAVYFGNMAGGFDLQRCPNSEANAALFAACDPATIARLIQRLDDAEADARRYRWLRDADNTDQHDDWALYALESLDEYIDAALAREK